MMESSVCSQEVSLVFVIPEGLAEDTCAPSLICAYQACMETDLNPMWKTSSDCLTLKPGKKDVFVCDPFEGDAFNYLKSDNFKCVVLGPRCLLSCLHRKMVVPELPSPLHNISMHKLIITLTGFEKEEKEQLCTIINRSSGIYSNNFSEAVTHLVAKTVGSKKYIVAIERDIPIMTGEWLRAVWNAVSREYREDIYATDEQFLSYTCPIFKNLVICVSQMPRKNKAALKKIIEENGGTYSASLEMAVTSVLIIPSPEGDKYEYARNWRIQCLKPDWIYDSVEIGHALNMDGYEVKNRGASTPTDENATNVPPDVSLCSTIMNETEMSRAVTHVNETLQQSTLADVSIVKRKSVSDEHASRGLEAVEELDLQKALKGGLFLDGCKIFLSGFSGPHMEKLRRVLNAGGATRFSQLTESVSHVIIGKVVEEHMNTILSWSSKPHVVYGDWITESIKLQKPADEAPFSYAQDKKSSPKKPEISSRKSSLSENRKLVPDNNETLVDEELMKKYMNRSGSNRDEETLNMSSFPDSQESTIPGIFHGKLFTITGYSQKFSEDYITAIREHGGEVVSLDYEGDVDYSITDFEGTGAVHEKAKEIVTHRFLDDCVDAEKHNEPVLVDVEYYHFPSQFIKGQYPLKDCIFALSGYTGVERQFLVSLASCLGATLQLTFAKKENPAKKFKASTHLICSTASGEKYKAALNWKLPAVTHNWLLACARSDTKEDENIYRVDIDDPVILDGKNILRNLFDVYVLGGKTLIDTFIGEVPPTPINSKVKSLRKESFEAPREVKTPDMETIRKMYPTPRASRGNQSLDEMPTPDTPYGRTWQPNPPPRVRKAYKRLLDSLPDEPPMKKPADEGTPVEVYYKRFQDKVKEDFKNFRVRTPVWFKKKDENTAKDLKDEETFVEAKEEKIEETEDEVAPENQGPLAGVVVCTAYKHHDQQRALYEAVTKLGGDYRWSLDNTVTHFIFQGQNNDKTREFRTARDEGKIIVAPEWVWMCQDENKKIDEELFPHTHNPKMSLSLRCTKNITNNKKGRPRKKHMSGDGKDEDINEEEMESVTNNTSLKMSSEINESLSKQLEEIEALASACGPERRSISRNKSISEKLKHTPTREVQVETQPVMMDIPETQNTAVTWDDPQEREARLRLQDQLTRDTQDIISGNMQTSEESQEDKENLPVLPEEESTQEPLSPCIPNKTSLSPEQNYLFVLSGILDEDRDRYVAIIVGLGGAMSSDQHFNIKCTHVVTSKPTRSEKNLAAIASGKWLLHTAFLEDSGKAGRFVEEESYEFGNPSAKYVSAMNKDSIEYKLSLCARRWRLTLSQDRKKLGAFHGMKALVHSNRDRTDAFTRLILAGGGEVLSATPPYRDVKGVSHFFIELNKNPGVIDFAYYASQRIPCLYPLYLNEYLVKDPSPDESEHFIPEYEEILKDMSNASTSFIKRRKK
ncbi:DNA topoisomerase 2-binding protein 1 isoform X2 [Palaemon carinicauda]|uniref:DNA topoisomerase 2-binding protein 1 isoform X2 n=1 Tax=Palaemon carinicauda TaxID=392227 RepID=UPI0035B67247